MVGGRGGGFPTLGGSDAVRHFFSLSFSQFPVIVTAILALYLDVFHDADVGVPAEVSDRKLVNMPAADKLLQLLEKTPHPKMSEVRVDDKGSGACAEQPVSFIVDKMCEPFPTPLHLDASCRTWHDRWDERRASSSPRSMRPKRYAGSRSAREQQMATRASSR